MPCSVRSKQNSTLHPTGWVPGQVPVQKQYKVWKTYITRNTRDQEEDQDKDKKQDENQIKTMKRRGQITGPKDENGKQGEAQYIDQDKGLEEIRI